MRIMGVDPSMSATGLCMPDGSTAVIKPRGEGDARLLYIEQRMTQAVRIARPDLIAMEDLQGEIRGAAAKALPMVQATVRLVAMRCGVPYAVVNPSTLKSFALGRQGDKAAMVLAAFKRMGREFTDDNECDAAWLRAAGHEAYGEPIVDLPKAHTDALRRVAWPRIPGAREPVAAAPPKQPRRRQKVAA